MAAADPLAESRCRVGWALPADTGPIILAGGDSWLGGQDIGKACGWQYRSGGQVYGDA